MGGGHGGVFLLTAALTTLMGDGLQDTLHNPLAARRPQGQVWTLGELEQRALAQNPTLAQAAERIALARASLIQARLYPNPVVGYHATEINNLGTAGQQGAFVQQRFVLPKKLKLSQQMAREQIEQAQHLFAAQQQRILSDVRIRFFDLLVAQRRVELAHRLVQIGDASVKASQRLLESRQASVNDLLQAQVEADKAEILLGTARNQHQEAWRRLAAVVGFSATGPACRVQGTVEESLPVLCWEETLAHLLNSSPELAAAHARVKRAGWQLKRERVEVLPDVTVAVSVRHNNPTGSDVANVQVGIPLPLFNRNQGKIQRARAELGQAHQERGRLRLSLQDRLAVAYRQYADARVKVEKYRERILPRAQRSLELVTKGYEEDQVGYLNVLVTQQLYFQANLAYLNALQQLRESTSLIQGQLLKDSLHVVQ